MTAPTPTPGTSPARGGESGEVAVLPRAFGRYVLFDLVGKGGMAEIYLARARTTEAGGARLVVVKQILPELSANQKFADALVQEAKLAARLSHANVVQVLDLGRAPIDGSASKNERLFITMEYVEGLDLNELLRRCARAKVPLPVEFALLVVMETLRGLDYAHRRADDEGHPLCIVHRDVSPSNVLVSVDGEVKLCDFGIARANEQTGTPGDAFSADAIQGKAGYMSPEQARGEPLDARADVFAAGVILWELLAGKRLYRADKENGESLLEVARRAEIPKLPERGLPHEGELHGIAARALAVERNKRFVSAAAMLDALQRYVVNAKLLASPIRFGEWLSTHFGNELVAARRSRERAVKALELGAVATVTPFTPEAREPPLRSIVPPSVEVAPTPTPAPIEATPPPEPIETPALEPAPIEAPKVDETRNTLLISFVVLLLVGVALALFFARCK
jgi:serine/threonine protein kinase